MFQLTLPLAFVLSTITGPPVKWEFSAVPLDDGGVEVRATARAEAGWHIYATTLENDLGPIPTSIRFTASKSYEFVGKLIEPVPVVEFDPNFEMQVRYHSGETVFAQRIKPTADGSFVMEGEVEYMVCNDVTCLPPVGIPFRIEVPTDHSKP